MARRRKFDISSRSHWTHVAAIGIELLPLTKRNNLKLTDNDIEVKQLMNTFKSTTSKSLITQTPNKRSETSPVTNYDCLQRFQFTDAGETREQRLSSNQFTRRVRNLESIYTKKERASVNKCEKRADQKAIESIRNEPGSNRSRNSKKNGERAGVRARFRAHLNGYRRQSGRQRQRQRRQLHDRR